MTKNSNTEILKVKAEEGRKIIILTAKKKNLQNKLDELSSNRYLIAAEINFDYPNKFKSQSSLKTFYKKKKIENSTELQYLGKEIVGKLNDLESILICDLFNMAKDHIQLKIDNINNILDKLA